LLARGKVVLTLCVAWLGAALARPQPHRSELCLSEGGGVPTDVACVPHLPCNSLPGAQESTPGAAGGYGGEATGIKSRVTKGRKL